ncbi:MAG: peptidylprolyl isomerase [Tepidisphaeraceae bacterium]
MTTLVSTLLLFSVLVPSKLWFAPGTPVSLDVKADMPVRLVMTDFKGHVINAKTDTTVPKPQTVDLTQLYPLQAGSTYVLYAVPTDQSKPFVGTPLVVEVRNDKRPGGPPGALVTRVEPLRYAEMETTEGKMTLAFFYDVAPNTVDNFLRLADEGYYDGIAFHRVIPNFVLQAGDPLSLDTERAGTGGPGYTIMQEFNRRPHNRGVLSMARQGDEGERQGNAPGPLAANSASSQFFICLNYDKTQALDGKYTVFGIVVEGDPVMTAIAKTPTGRGDRPLNPPLIKKLAVKTVNPDNNPYSGILVDR